jgi:anti-sigma regulatory factor (Ser/Thr protein kinase)
MGEALSLQFSALSESIPRARHAIRSFCVRAGIPDQRLGDIQIAVTEACANCVRHAYDALEEDSAYRLEARIDADNLVMVVSDYGVGLSGSTPGLGMKLIHRAADRVLVTSPAGHGARIEMHFALTG